MNFVPRSTEAESTSLFLTRAKLTNNFERLAPLLLANSGTTHRVVWSLFPRELKQRPFLYREGENGEFFVLSSIAPTDGGGLFDIQSRPFAPALRAGDRLHFTLRANPVVTKNIGGRATRHDVVMHAMRDIPAGERHLHRDETVQTAGLEWLRKQGASAGFVFDDEEIVIGGYRQERRHAQLDFEGTLTVTDPALFLSKISAGFGRARAFGYGLMLVKRG